MLTRQRFSEKTAIVGIGWTAFTRASGASVLSLAAEASLKAIDDAGISPAEIDGVITFRYDGMPGGWVDPGQLVHTIGCESCSFQVFANSGGRQCCGVVATAAVAVYSGLCRNVLVYYASNGYSQRRATIGKSGQSSSPRSANPISAVFGALHPAATFGLPVVAHMARYGTTNRDFGWLAVTQRHHAALNTKAMMRRPITIDEHQQSPWIVYPYRLLDCCLQTDGGVALIVSSAERGQDCPSSVLILSACGSIDDRAVRWQTAAEKSAAKLYGHAGITADCIDLAELYDPFSGMCLLHIEGFGLTPPGQSGPWVSGGNASLDGMTPVNTHGGLLSEGYMHGINGIIEAVQQLRPEGVVDDLCQDGHDYVRDRCRQVRDAQIALVCGEAGSSALLLRKT